MGWQSDRVQATNVVFRGFSLTAQITLTFLLTTVYGPVGD
jgi:hypothetical protein